MIEFLLAVVNLGLYAYVAYAYIRIMRERRRPEISWLYRMKAILGLLWGVLYLIITLLTIFGVFSMYQDEIRIVSRSIIGINAGVLAACARSALRR